MSVMIPRVGGHPHPLASDAEQHSLTINHDPHGKEEQSLRWGDEASSFSLDFDGADASLTVP